jgi:predicted Rossmann-fold nucleotide-binding protein
MKVGFTGTRAGMSLHQQREFTKMLSLYGPGHTFLHGGCEGADREAEEIALSLGWKIEKHLPATFTSRDFLERNRVIVRSSDILIAAPKTDKEVLRSGTWATVRYAQKTNKPIVILER